jgi:MFS family permease
LADALTPDATETPYGDRLLGSQVLGRLAAALTYRDFRILWAGACTSSIGTWMQSLAENWLVLTLTGSAFYLGLDSFLQQLPIVLFTLLGGVLADRHDRRRTLLGSQYVQMGSATMLAILVYTDSVRVWHILALSFLTGSAQSFGGPAYQSLIPALVASRDLPNAVALNSIQFNLARLVGPLLAGATLAAFTRWGFSERVAMGSCFTLNALSFLVVIVALMSLHVQHTARPTTRSILSELGGGLSYVRHEPRVLALTVLAALTTFLGFPLLTLLPVIARGVFQAGVEEYSRLMVFSAAGAVSGALVIAWLGRFPRMGRTVLVAQVAFAVLIVAFAFSEVRWLSYLLLFTAGAMLMVVASTVTSLVQLIAPNELRGRVMSIYMMAFRGGMPLGSLTSGYVASVSSAPLVLGINGALMALVALYFLTGRPQVREI